MKPGEPLKRKTELARQAMRRVEPKNPVKRVCETCGGVFDAFPYEVRRGRARFCSRTCWNGRTVSAETRERQRRSSPDRRGKKNPNHRHGAREGENLRAEKAAFVDPETRCCMCGRRDRLQQHHVVYRQHIRREGGWEYDPRDARSACDRCHMSHHRRGRVIPVSKLRPENIVFAVELFGRERARGYFERYYLMDRPERLEGT